jgi:heme exporter protein A
MARTSRGALVIRARGLAKRYGAKRIFDGLDLDVERGAFVVVTGPNGSGKTTLMRLVAGLIRPSGGELEVDAERAQLGFLGHEALVYRDLSAMENLQLYARLYRVSEARERIGMLLERFDLWESRNERAGAYSRGMLQRLALCRTFLHEPTLLLLDEPYSALDEEGAELLDRELDARRAGATFLVATHDPVRLEPFASAGLAFA